ncbi:MAG TPA: tRNA (adenosine(37)-N6)-threonylcarbamoyltransferase complex ATPase subunit type 1 TsaE [Verrucomicrobiae bacterium]|nr:tRNA (adenosine(37)-N6)-threonylcarbamoyltransferase complex ATPase subunit type 1 TsaE [Verrucomicrobiae bacterium]
MPMIVSNSPDETLQLGEQWGREAKPGWVIGLTGDLGAGKTQFVKGIARGLGIRSRISSPTFTLVHEYREGRLPLYHIDLYRLDTMQDVFAAGLEEYFGQTDGVTVVEWSERYPLKANRQARIESSGESQRRISYENSGA